MKKILSGIVISLLMLLVGYGQEQSLQITINPFREVYNIGEEIILRIELKNLNEKPYMVKDNWISFVKVYCNGKQIHVDGSPVDPGEDYPSAAGFITTRLIPLSNGQVLTNVYGQRLHPQLGKFKFLVSYNNITSNTITIEVVGPEEAILSAKKILLTHKKCQSLIKKYPEIINNIHIRRWESERIIEFTGGCCCACDGECAEISVKLTPKNTLKDIQTKTWICGLR